MKAKTALPDELYSADQLLAVAEELHQFGIHMAKTGSKTEPLSPLAETAFSMISAPERNKPEAVENLRAQLEQMAATAPAITLTLAASPPRTLRNELVRWLRQSIRPDILVNIHVNPDIAGGVVIRSTNRIYDCSFRSALLAHADQFGKVLERV